MKETKLKPCPFCDSKHIDITSYGEVMWFIQCDNCYATFPEFETKEQAIDAWNRRATDERAD